VSSYFNEHVRGATISKLVVAGSVVSVDSIWHVFLHLSAPVNHQYFKQEDSLGYRSFNEYGFEVESSSHNDCQRGFIKLLASGDWAIPDLKDQPEYLQEPKWLEIWNKDTLENKDLSRIVNIQKDWNRNSIAHDFTLKIREGKVFDF